MKILKRFYNRVNIFFKIDLKLYYNILFILKKNVKLLKKSYFFKINKNINLYYLFFFNNNIIINFIIKEINFTINYFFIIKNNVINFIKFFEIRVKKFEI